MRRAESNRSMIDGREKLVSWSGCADPRAAARGARKRRLRRCAFATDREGLEAARQPGTDLIVLDAAAGGLTAPAARQMRCSHARIRGPDGTRPRDLADRRGPDERAAGLDLGADDAISRPWDAAELLARVRTQLRVLRAELRFGQDAVGGRRPADRTYGI